MIYSFPLIFCCNMELNIDSEFKNSLRLEKKVSSYWEGRTLLYQSNWEEDKTALIQMKLKAKNYREISEAKNCFFEKINKSDKLQQD